MQSPIAQRFRRENLYRKVKMENLTLVKRLGLMKVKLMFVCKYRDENVSASRKQSWIVVLELLDLILKEIKLLYR